MRTPLTQYPIFSPFQSTSVVDEVEVVVLSLTTLTEAQYDTLTVDELEVMVE